MPAVTLNLLVYFIAFTVCFFGFRKAMLPDGHQLFSSGALVSYVLTLGASAVLVFLV